MRIDKNVPLPPRYQKVIGTLRELEVGDSFEIPKDYKDSEGYRKKMNSYYVAAGRIGIEITSRVQEDSVRIWRTK